MAFLQQDKIQLITTLLDNVLQITEGSAMNTRIQKWIRKMIAVLLFFANRVKIRPNEVNTKCVQVFVLISRN